MRHKIISIILVAMLPVALLTSCDPEDWDYRDYYGGWYDDYNWYSDPFDYGTDDLTLMAQTLRGQWTGQLRADYINSDGQRTVVDYDTYMAFDQYDSRSLNGRGTEEDYLDGTLDAQENFSWYIDPRSGNIYIQFDKGREMCIKYSDLSLDNNAFSGTITGQNVDEYDDFSFQRTTYASSRALLTKGQTSSTAQKDVTTTTARRQLKTAK